MEVLEEKTCMKKCTKRKHKDEDHGEEAHTEEDHKEEKSQSWGDLLGRILGCPLIGDNTVHHINASLSCWMWLFMC